MATTISTPDPVVSARLRPVYTRVEVLGLLLAAAAPATALLAALVTGMSLGEDVAFFAVAIAIPLLGAALVWRFGAWSKVLGVVAGLLAGLALFWMAFGLAYPASVADFLPGVLLPLGVAMAVAGGIAAVIQQRRRNLAVAATPAERRIAAGALGIALLALLASGTLMLVNRSPADVPGALSATIADFTFSEETYALIAGQPTTLVVHNSDPFVHTFTIPELGIDEVVPPGGDAVVEVTAPAGTYTLYCKPHADMSDPDPATAGMAAAIVAR